MRLAVDKIKDAILHPDPDVREEAVYYFARSFSEDQTVMPLAIEAFERHGLDAFLVFSFMGSLQQSERSVAWLIREIEQRTCCQSEREQDYNLALRKALRHADPILLRSHEATILGMRNLDELSRRIVADRIVLSSFEPKRLWKELVFCCAAEKRTEDEIDDYGYEHLSSVVDVLSRQADPSSDSILQLLENADFRDAWLERMTVQLTGKIKLEAAIPQLVDRLEPCGTWLFEESRWALARIGNDAVVKELGNRGFAANYQTQLTIASVLEDIHSDLAVELSIGLLAEEADPNCRAYLLQAILMNFAPVGIELARQHVLATLKSPDMLAVRSALLVACKVMGETFPEFDVWIEDSRNDEDFRRQWFLDSCLGAAEIQRMLQLRLRRN